MAASLIAFGLLDSSLASAGWNTDPVVVSTTTANIAMLRSATDGQFGAMFVWQEATTPSVGVLRAQRMLASGDRDPVWPPMGATVCSVAVRRRELEIVPDDAGGCFVLWTEDNGSTGSSLYAQHVLISGARAPSWPARGLRVGTSAVVHGIRISAVRDGTGGLYVAWQVSGAPLTARWTRLRASGVVGGWPIAGRPLEPTLSPNAQLWPVLALTPESKVVALWASFSPDPELPSGHRLNCFNPNGSVAAGWPADGILAAGFNLSWLSTITNSLGSLAASPDGGTYALLPSPDADTRMHMLLQRRDAHGTIVPDWGESGVEVAVMDQSETRPAMPMIVSDGSGGVLFARRFTTIHGPGNESVISRVGPSPLVGPSGSSSLRVQGNQLRVRGQVSGINHVLVRQDCASPEGYYTPAVESRIEIHSLSSSGVTHVSRVAATPNSCCFGETAIEPLPDGGSIAAWVSTCETRGILALRTAGARVVTDIAVVPEAKTGLRSTSHEVGRGVRVSYTLASIGLAEIRLLDLMGRTLGGPYPLEPVNQGEVLLSQPQLRPGLVVVQLTQGELRASRKLIITH